MIPWQQFYQTNKHLPMGKILSDYNRVLLEFNEKLAQINNITQNTPTPGCGSGGPVPIKEEIVDPVPIKEEIVDPVYNLLVII